MSFGVLTKVVKVVAAGIRREMSDYTADTVNLRKELSRSSALLF